MPLRIAKASAWSVSQWLVSQNHQVYSFAIGLNVGLRTKSWLIDNYSYFFQNRQVSSFALVLNGYVQNHFMYKC